MSLGLLLFLVEENNGLDTITAFDRISHDCLSQIIICINLREDSGIFFMTKNEAKWHTVPSLTALVF